VSGHLHFNTAARLQEYAKRTGLDLVVSGALLERLVLPSGVETRCAASWTSAARTRP